MYVGLLRLISEALYNERLSQKTSGINKQVVVQTEQIFLCTEHCDCNAMLSATQQGVLKLLVQSVGEVMKFSFTFGFYITKLAPPNKFYYLKL